MSPESRAPRAKDERTARGPSPMKRASAPRPAPALAADAHKGDAGRVLCFVGSESMPGAAVLSARAAQRAGAGLVTVACLDPNPFAVLAGSVPEAVLYDLRAFDPDGEGAREVFSYREPHARLVGPGLGDGARTRKIVDLALACEDAVPLVLDADGLNVLAGEPERLQAHAGPIVVTPHPGEASRLLGRGVPKDEAGRVAFARDLAERSGAIVCLKGRGTVVTDGRLLAVNETGNPGMASAGSGDVLAGILVAYLALCARTSDWTPFDAARSAVFVHGRAGDLAAGELGSRAMIASDLVRFLPEAQRGLEGPEG